MKEKSQSLLVTGAATIMIASGLMFSHSLVDGKDLFSKVKAEGIQLPPTLEVPEEKDLLNKAMKKKDVQRTLQLEKYQLELKTAQATISEGVKVHLGYDEKELTANQMLRYNESVRDASESIRDLTKNPKSVPDVFTVTKDFKASMKQLANKIHEEKFEAEAEKLRQKVETKKDKVSITEVVDMNETTSPDTEIPNPESISYSVPKLTQQYLTYEPYTAITAVSTPHYRLQQMAKTNKVGYRVYDNAICVALASSFGTKIGTIYNITFDDGKKMRAILGDNKADIHTDKKNQYRDATGVYDGSSGNIVEIIFDRTGFPSSNAVNRQINGDYPGKVVSIEKVGTAKGFE